MPQSRVKSALQSSRSPTVPMPAVAPTAADFDFAASGRRVLEVESQGLAALAGRIDGAFSAACRLLLEGEYSVADICFQVGYNNLSNFNRHFREQKGMTPRQYQQQTADLERHVTIYPLP